MCIFPYLSSYSQRGLQGCKKGAALRGTRSKARLTAGHCLATQSLRPRVLPRTTLGAELHAGTSTVSILGIENELTSEVRKTVYRLRKPPDNGVKKRELEV